MLNNLFNRLNTLVIGKFYSVKDLGFYSRADSTSSLPGEVICGIISRVAFPVFSAAQENKSLLRAGLRKAIIVVAMCNMPIMLGMAVSAKPLVTVLFGNQWSPCVPYLQILSLVGILWPMQLLNLNILLAQGHSHLYFRLETFKKFVGIVLMGTACFFSILAIAWAAVLTELIGFWISTHYNKKFLDYSTLRQIIDLLPYLGVALIMTVCSWAVSFLPLTKPILLVIAQVSVGTAVYVALCASLRLNGFMEAWNMARTILAKRLLPASASQDA